jgi:PKD repeat protein
MKIYIYHLVFLFTLGLFTSCNKTTISSPEASFDNSPYNDIKAGMKITFTNTSKNATEYLWDFGDGNSSNTENPTHTYLKSGSYNVLLTAKNASSSDIETITIAVDEHILVGTWHGNTTMLDMNNEQCILNARLHFNADNNGSKEFTAQYPQYDNLLIHNIPHIGLASYPFNWVFDKDNNVTLEYQNDTIFLEYSVQDKELILHNNQFCVFGKNPPTIYSYEE